MERSTSMAGNPKRGEALELEEEGSTLLGKGGFEAVEARRPVARSPRCARKQDRNLSRRSRTARLWLISSLSGLARIKLRFDKNRRPIINKLLDSSSRII